MSRSLRRLKVVTGNANPDLAKAVCQYLGIEQHPAKVERFPDGELNIQVRDVRGDCVFVVQPTCPPVNEHLMELCGMLRAASEGSARRRVAVVPYFGYGRQERKAESGVPIMARLAADMIHVAGASHVVVIDLHAAAIQGYFSLPCDHVLVRPALVHALRETGIEKLVTPDEGALKSVLHYAGRMGLGHANMGKVRLNGAETKSLYLNGDVKGLRCAIIDDIIATAGTAVDGGRKLLEEGASSVSLVATHPVCAGRAIERLASETFEGRPIFDHIWTTDTIPLRHRLTPEQAKRFTIVSIAPLLGEAILRVFLDDHLSPLFEVEGYLAATGQA